MIKQLLSFPLRAARVAVRFVRGNKGPKSDGPLAYTPASGGLKRPAEAVHATPAADEDDHDRGHDHGHSHGHDHGHSHGHDHDQEHAEPAPASAAVAPPPAEAAPAAPAKKAAKKAAKPTPSVRVHAEQTPNPNARKFTVDGRPVVEKGSISFNSREEAAGHPLGEALFQVTGVRSVFAVKDFVTVTKEAAADWAQVEPAVTRVLQDQG